MHCTSVANFSTMPDHAPQAIDAVVQGDLTSLDDDALMAAFAKELPRAFDALYQRHRAGLYRFVRRLLGPSNASLVDEVFQDTWMRVVQARSRWKPQGATFRTWLYTVAHNRTVDVLRRSGREVAVDATDDVAPFEPDREPWELWPSVASHTPTQDDTLFWRRAGERLLACLAELPLAQKAVFLLHHEDGDSVDTIADTLGVGFETAKSRLRYAMSKLRTCMGAYLDPMQSSKGNL